MKLLQNPLLKFIGVAAVIYFALFANKKNPESLGNRVSISKVKEHIGEIEEKSRFIATNVKAAREYSKMKDSQPKVVLENNLQQQEQARVIEPEIKVAEVENKVKEEGVVVKDIAPGSGSQLVLCGSEVNIIRSLASQTLGQVDFANSEKLVIGSKKNWLIEKNIIGMKKGGLRSITIARDFKTSDKKIRQLLETRKSDVTYQIILVDLKPGKVKADCK
jgi:hypothetical protein